MGKTQMTQITELESNNYSARISMMMTSKGLSNNWDDLQSSDREDVNYSLQ